MKSTFLLFVTYHAKSGCREKFVKELEESGVASLVRQEDGCIRYDYYYSAADENAVLLFEEWESEAHQQVHITQPHIKTIQQLKEAYIERTELRQV